MVIPLLDAPKYVITPRNLRPTAWADPSVAGSVYSDTAVQFTAADKAYLSVASNATLQTGNIDFEIGGWFYFDTLTAARGLMAKGLYSTNTQEYSLTYYAGANIKFEVGNGSAKTSLVVSTPSTGTWYFIRCWRSTDGSINAQVNNGTISTSASATTPATDSNAFTVGYTNSAYQDGRADSVYFTKRISTTDEATALYNAGAGRRYADLTADNGLATFKTNMDSTGVWYDFAETSGTRYNATPNTGCDLAETFSSMISESVANGGGETRGTDGGTKTNVAIQHMHRDGAGTVTVEATGHGLSSTNVFSVTGMSNSAFNVTNKTATVLDANTFTYAQAGAEIEETSSTGRITTHVFDTWELNTIATGTSSINLETSAPYAGSNAFRFDIDASSTQTSVSQIILTTGHKYTATYYAKASTATGNPTLGVLFGSTNVGSSNLTTDYAQQTASGTANSTRFYIYRNTNTASKSLYFDNVVLTCTEIPSAGGIAQGISTNGQPIAKWMDQSGNLQHFTQMTLSKRPTWQLSAFNTYPCASFDGVDDILSNAADLIGTGDTTVYVAIKPAGWGGGNLGRIIDNSKFVVRVNTTNALLQVSSNDSTEASSANNSIALGTACVIAITRTAAGVANLYINGSLSGTADQSSGTPAAGSPTYLGNNAAGTRAFYGMLGDVLLYSGIHTPEKILR